MRMFKQQKQAVWWAEVYVLFLQVLHQARALHVAHRALPLQRGKNHWSLLGEVELQTQKLRKENALTNPEDGKEALCGKEEANTLVGKYTSNS